MFRGENTVDPRRRLHGRNKNELVPKDGQIPQGTSRWKPEAIHLVEVTEIKVYIAPVL